MRDADDLDRILGRPGLVSLMLHGNSGPGVLDRLSSGLIAVSPGTAGDGQYQLVTVRRDGLRRHARQYAATQRRWIGDIRISPSGSDWHASIAGSPTKGDAALPPPRATLPDEPLSALPDHDQFADPAETPPRPLADVVVNEFLERVAEATRVRFPEATVTQRAEENYLRVTRPRPAAPLDQCPIAVIHAPPPPPPLPPP